MIQVGQTTSEGDAAAINTLEHVYRSLYLPLRPANMELDNTLSCSDALASMAIDQAANDRTSIALNFEKVTLLESFY